MSELASFLQRTLYEGRILLRQAPTRGDDAAAGPLLEKAYRAHALSVAGPAVPFEPAVALAAGRVLQAAAWYLLNQGAELDEAALRMPYAPTRPEHHLSADLVFRFLPVLHRRARALMANDPLPEHLATLLRRWPLSGVLSDVIEEPLTPPDFGHAGLQMLYAERLARHDRPAWLPPPAGLPYVELVWQQLGKDTARLPPREEVRG